MVDFGIAVAVDSDLDFPEVYELAAVVLYPRELFSIEVHLEASVFSHQNDFVVGTE